MDSLVIRNTIVVFVGLGLVVTSVEAMDYMPPLVLELSGWPFDLAYALVMVPVTIFMLFLARRAGNTGCGAQVAVLLASIGASFAFWFVWEVCAYGPKEALTADYLWVLAYDYVDLLLPLALGAAVGALAFFGSNRVFANSSS